MLFRLVEEAHSPCLRWKEVVRDCWQRPKTLVAVLKAAYWEFIIIVPFEH